MSKAFCVLFLVLALLAGPAFAAPPAPQAVTVGSPMPPSAFEAPKEAAARAYLGLGEGQTLDPAKVPAPLVIVEIFNMYCPHCQHEAPIVNRLYELIQNKGWGDKVKLVGIGAKNSAFEVEVFVKHYRVPFPMVPDRDLKTLDLFGGQVSTPHFVVIARKKDGSNRVIYSQSGPLPPVEKFLADMAAQAGVK